MYNIKVTERGWINLTSLAWNPEDCRFRRNTLINCDDNYFCVVTIGDYFQDGKIKPIPFEGKTHYITRVCRTIEKQDIYIECNIDNIVKGITKFPLNIESYNEFSDYVVNENHDKIVQDVINAYKQGVLE